MTTHLAEVTITETADEITVEQVWAGVDRPIGAAFALRKNHMPLARRLKAAMLAGRAMPFREVRADVNGKTYVSTECNVIGRTMNADLLRLGF